MAGIIGLIEDLEKALGAEAADQAAAEARADGAEIEGNPSAEITDQATKIAEAIRDYLQRLAGDGDFVQKP